MITIVIQHTFIITINNNLHEFNVNSILPLIDDASQTITYEQCLVPLNYRIIKTETAHHKLPNPHNKECIQIVNYKAPLKHFFFSNQPSFYQKYQSKFELTNYKDIAKEYRLTVSRKPIHVTNKEQQIKTWFQNRNLDLPINIITDLMNGMCTMMTLPKTRGGGNKLFI